MAAMLSADDLNDFISPGVACIKPIESLPSKPTTNNPDDPYEVTTEDQLAAANPAPAQISLTDCLACSGCVTSAEALLVSLQSHAEVLGALDRWPGLGVLWEMRKGEGVNGYANGVNGHGNGSNGVNAVEAHEGKIFVATVSPQVKASLAATYGISMRQAENMIAQLFSGADGLASGGAYGNRFTWILDSNIFREIALIAATEEVTSPLQAPPQKKLGDGSAMTDKPKQPILTSACPGWICYAEKTHPHVLPHLSRLKSPQALAGMLVKSILAKKHNINPSNIWHLAIMPCFDKKLEASRSELTSAIWSGDDTSEPVRDVDCVITARELISLAAARGIDFSQLSRSPLPSSHRVPFPDKTIDSFLFPHPRRKDTSNADAPAGTSGGFLYHILRRIQAQHSGSSIDISRGRNADMVKYVLLSQDGKTPIIRFARYYGSRNISNLVRKLKPPETSRLLAAAGARARPMGNVRRPGGANGASSAEDYAYVEVMACPGGCTNGGGQIRAGELESLRAGEGLPVELKRVGPAEARAWLGTVDEAYFSAESEESDGDEMDVDGVEITNGETPDVVDGISRSKILGLVQYWTDLTGIDAQTLTCTSYRKVESDVGKKVSDVDRVAGLASSLGGGW